MLRQQPLVVKISEGQQGSCICVIGVLILPLSTIVILDCRIVPTLWYFFHFSFELEPIVTMIPISSRSRSKYNVSYTLQITTSEGSNSLSPLRLWVRTPLMAKCTWCNIIWKSLSFTCDKSGTPVSFTNKTDGYLYSWNVVESGVKHIQPIKQANHKVQNVGNRTLPG